MDFIKAAGRSLQDSQGQDIYLQGVGLGGWLLPEGYMWKLPATIDRPRRIEKMVADWLGPVDAESFWHSYYSTFIGENDIQAIAEFGFNSVRLPLNARTLQPFVLSCVDQVIAWCRQYNLYVILDLHGAPGGQTGTNIDDSENDRPELFTSERYRQQCIDLWGQLAARYRDEPAVAGYDLLNEPLPKWFAEHNHLVMPLYRDIIREIRKHDSKHLLILEGVHWATDWSIFDEMPDDNVMLQFHQYWNNPDQDSIQPYLDARERWNVPIFMGEGGENNKDWYAGLFQMLRDFNISWNFWTWKKMGCTNSPYSIPIPGGWARMVEYAENPAVADAAEGRLIFGEFLRNIKTARLRRDWGDDAPDNGAWHPAVVRAIFHRIPVRIPAAFYGFKGPDVSYHAEKARTSQLAFRRHDRLDCYLADHDRLIPNFQHMAGEEWLPAERPVVQLTAGEWTAYEIAVAEDDVCELAVDVELKTVEAKSICELLFDDFSLGQKVIDHDDIHTVTWKIEKSVSRAQHQLKVKCVTGCIELLAFWCLAPKRK